MAGILRGVGEAGLEAGAVDVHINVEAAVEVDTVAGVLRSVLERGSEAGLVNVDINTEVLSWVLETAGLLSLDGRNISNLLGALWLANRLRLLRSRQWLRDLRLVWEVLLLVEVEVTAGEFGGGLVVVEVLEDLSDEAVELGVLLDVVEAVTASADDSIELRFRGLILILEERSLHIEGKVLLLDDLVDIEAELSGVNNLAEDLVLNSVVSDVGNEGSLGNGGNFLVVVGIDVLDVVGGILHDLFDLLSGVTRVRLFLDDLGGLVVGVVHNLIDLLLLLSLSLLDLLLLSLVVDLSDQLEALLDLLNNGLDLLGRGLNGKGVGDLEGVVVDVTDVVLVDDGDGTLGHLLLDLIRKVGDQLSLTLPRGLDGTVLNTDCRDRTEEKGNRERVHLCFYVSS